jgi:major vault protein
MSSTTERHGDLILPQGTYALVQDGASGQVDVVVGPHKVSLADTDKPVIYDHNTRRFARLHGTGDAVLVNPAANEGQYMVLVNPSKDDGGKKHPTKGKQAAADLAMGHKINIPGPYTMPLFPGQVALVLDGHLLKSNEYLLCRVYNEESAKNNLKDAVIKTATDTESDDAIKVSQDNLIIGKLFIIKGTDVSFYIPPTGIEVVKSDDGYVRKAVTLERLEYCILLDQNGDKRFVQGPAVVFPKPTETFVEQGGSNKFKAIELNENMGIYVKVIHDYNDGDDKYKSGDELFITGNDQKIYFPRPEHAIIKYGDQMVHYATAVPSGEARYVLNKRTGEVNLVQGPKMLLPDPKDSVVVKRVLDDRTVSLWFPNNQEALDYNRNLRMQDVSTDVFDTSGELYSRSLKASVRFSAVADEMQRSSTYTKPRTITLDTKYEGAVRINVWPGYAIQVVKKTGERELVEGPKVRLLEYDEDLEVLALSTGKPKSDTTLHRTTYLQKENNVVSDIIEAETFDSVTTSVRLSYRVNFHEDYKEKWFSVSDYVKLLTQHIRSIVRNKIKKTTIEEFSQNATDIIRDLVLGQPGEDAKRPGRMFEENGMHVYDIEVLSVKIGDESIEQMIKNAQQSTVEHRLKLQSKLQEFEYISKLNEITRKELDIRKETVTKKHELDVFEINNDIEVKNIKLDSDNSMAIKKKESEKAVQEFINYIEEQEREREKLSQELVLEQEARRTAIRTEAHEKHMKAIQPGLIEAITTMSNNQFVEILAKNLQHKTNGFGSIFSGGFEGILELVKGSPLEDKIKSLVESGKKIN